jgi:glucose-6-phosphate isomerase/transaldolase/glucose-6-phosphate isomerase
VEKFSFVAFTGKGLTGIIEMKSGKPNGGTRSVASNAPARSRRSATLHANALDTRFIWSGVADGWNHPRGDEIVKWLGWLRLPETMPREIPRLESFAASLRADGIRHVVLLGMGGSSLAPLVMASMFKPSRGFPKLHVLDSTNPANVAAVEKAVELRKTVFIVASKSGTTIEPNCFYKFFRERVKEQGGRKKEEGGWAKQFVAITDENTALHKEAVTEGFRDVFIAPSDVGGRYSALSFFGLVPAACIGIPLRAFLAKAREMAAQCGAGVSPDENVGMQLGAAMGLAALEGRDKLTLILPKRWEKFGLWVEQLVAESTGKQGKGIVPIAGEPLRDAGDYGDDRFFVQVRESGKRDAGVERRVDALRAAGHPVHVIEVGTDRWAVRNAARSVPKAFGTPYQLGAEFFRWEFATATAGAVLGINPFDQPNVQSAKDQTNRIIAQFVASGKMPSGDAGSIQLSGKRGAESVEREAVMREFLASIKPNDYLALLAYLPIGDELEKPLTRALHRLGKRLRVATTFGYGPRYLHSTGQLHKGGANNGVFIVLTAEPKKDLAIPTEKFTFAQLERAQALGDVAALQSAGRRVLRVHLDAPTGRSVEGLALLLERATKV